MTKELNARLQRLEATIKRVDRTAYDHKQSWRLAREWYGETIAQSLYNDNDSPFMLLTVDELRQLRACEDNQASLSDMLKTINTRPKSEWRERYERYKNKANAVGLI